MPGASAESVLDVLRQKASAANRRGWTRAGAGLPSLGVTLGDLRAVARLHAPDPTLAQALWSTDLLEARLLASLVEDAAGLTTDQAEQWIDTCVDLVVVDAVCALVGRSPVADRLALTWAVSPDVHRARAGWGLIAHLANDPDRVSDRWLDPFLDHIVRTADQTALPAREAMAAVLVSVAHARPLLRAQAVSAATFIGPLAASNPRRRWPMPNVAAFIAKLIAQEVDRPKKKRSKATAKKPAKKPQKKPPQKKATPKTKRRSGQG